jgi:Uma2 family endonuclease
MRPPTRTRISADEYLERERRAETKSELVNGEIVAMAGGSPRHNAIAANIIFAIKARLAGRRCMVFTSDQRVLVPATGLYTYPDVSVTCEKPQLDPKDEQSLVNPTALVEVLSTSTEAYDRGAKFAHYRTIPFLEEYMLVSQDTEQVEHYRRVDAKQWLLTEAKGQDAMVVVLGVEVPLREIYANLDLLEDGGG